jgi:4-phytase / acid phosphatase
MRSFRSLLILSFSLALPFRPAVSFAQPANQDEQLKFVVYLSRHGVRSPTGKPAQYDKYSAAPWPQWDVPPGYLTPHGYTLMKLFGSYDRELLASEGLLAPKGCGDADHVTILADSDQRTRETGKALAEGMFPGCSVEVHALPEGSHDPLFHFLEAGAGNVDHSLAVAAISGRIGGDANNLTEAYRLQLSALDQVLGGCGHASAAEQKRTSLFNIPASLAPGKDDHPTELRGPLNTTSSLSENLLLEYTQGMPAADVGWGCVDGQTLRNLMQLHTAAAEFALRTPVVARMYASNLLSAILKALEQSATGKPVAGAPGKPGDRMLLLVGHDTNIATVAGALGLNWILDGRKDDTPPGGSLVFELWSTPTGESSVRVYYTAQTLEQMRNRMPLTKDRPPARVQVFVPGCNRSDLSCTWQEMSSALRQVINPAFVSR